MIIDLHVHGEQTKGGHPIGEAAAAAQTLSIDAIVIVEADQTVDLAHCKAAEEETEIRIFVGVELNTDRGTMILYPPTSDGAYEERGWGTPDGKGVHSFSSIRSFCEENGWVIVAAQPYFNEHRIGDEIYEIGGVNAVEIVHHNTPLLAQDLATEAALALQMVSVGGSGPTDSIDLLFKHLTVFLEPIQTQAELVQGLRRGNCWVMTTQPPIVPPKAKPGRRRARKRKPRNPPSESSHDE